MPEVVNIFRRVWHAILVDPVPKTDKPLRCGLIGASSIAPHSLIAPARTHADIAIQAVAARDIQKARAFATKYGIPEVKASYQELLDDPRIDCVYISISNSFHYEWALRALKAGKHVLLEKPGANNSSEAEILFKHPLLKPYYLRVGPDVPSTISRKDSDADSGIAGADLSFPPVLMEAMHNLYHPAWEAFMDYIDHRNVASAKADIFIPKFIFSNDANCFKFELGGGALMYIGGYTASALLRIFGEGPVDCLSCETDPAVFDARCDRTFKTKFRFENGGIGQMEGHLRGPLDKFEPVISVTHKPTVVPANTAADAAAAAAGVTYPIPAGYEIVRVRKVKYANFLMPTGHHSIKIDDDYILQEAGSLGRRGSGSIELQSSHTRSLSSRDGHSRASSSTTSLGTGQIKRWKKSQTVRAFTYEDSGKGQKGHESWTTYRYQLEQFVNKCRGRKPGQWFSAQDSLDVQRMLDMAYVMAGLPLRPTSESTVS